MAEKLTPICILSFLCGVGIRSFFEIPLKFSWMIVGVFLGFVVFEKITYSLHSQRTSDLLSSPPLLTKERGLGGEVKNYWFEKINTAALIIILFFLGIIRLSYFEKNIEKDNLHNFYGQNISVEGVVLESKITQASRRSVLKTDLGKILMVTKVFPEYKYGDVLKIDGEIKEPENLENFDAKKILAKDKIFSEIVFPQIEYVGYSPPSKIMSLLFFVKDKFQKNLKAILPEPHSSLSEGMLLGSEGVLEKNILDAFKKSGTSHILVLSGYNITVVGVVLIKLLSFLPSFFSFAGSILGIILFTLMAGGQPPAVRAAIMGIIGLLVFRSGRLRAAFLALLWSAFFMVLWNPAVLSFDRGFQLSFLATLGLIVFSGFFVKKFKFLPKFLSIRENAASTFAAQIFVLPLLISWGNHISYLSPLANILILASVPYVMLFSFLGGLGAFLFHGLGQAVASVAFILISYQIYVAKIFSTF